MNASPQTPDDPHEPSRGGPPRDTPTGRHSGPGPAQQRGLAPPPPQLKRLLALTLVSGVVYVAFGAVVTVMFATMDIAAMYQRMGMPAEEAGQVGTMVEQMRGFSLASGLIGLAVLVGLYAMEYVFLRKGANWARILGIVLAILSSVGFLGNIFGFWLYGQWAIVLIAIAAVFVLVNIAWLVTAFRAPVRDWFAQQRHTG